jgi:hypothetical protein
MTLSFTLSAQANGGIDTATLPRFYFKDGKTHDFGKVADGDQPTYRFIFKNTGKSPLFITDISLSCECFSVDWVKYPIQPGGEGWILVQFPFTGRIGTFSKLLWVVSNAMVGGGEREELMITGNVVEGPVTAKLPTFEFLQGTTHDFGKIPEGSKANYQFLFRNKGAVPLTISAVEADCKCLDASFQKEPILPGHAGWIQTTYYSEGRPGAFDKTFRVKSNAGKPGEVVKISLKGTVVPEKGVNAK